MYRTLSFKLIMAFLLISIIGAVLSAFIARQTTLTEFDRLILDRYRSDFVTNISQFYEDNGSWDGIEDYIPNAFGFREPRDEPDLFVNPFSTKPEDEFPQSPPADNNRKDDNTGKDDNKGDMKFLFALVDQQGVVLIAAAPYNRGDHVDQLTLEEDGIAVEIDGVSVGTVLTSDNLPELDPRDEKYLQRTNTSSLYAAVIAAAIALLVGIILARTMTSPLRELTHAISAIAQGDLNQKVRINSKDELGELANAFNQMSEDLAHANHLRRQMTADIAHDLRSPLTVISGYIESMRDGILEPDTERLNIINDEVAHLQRLVDDLRTLSLADANELTLNQQFLPTIDFIERTAMTYQHRAEQLQITLETQCNEEIPNIYIDSERMMQVLGNLIDNSMRHTPAGGKITLSCQYNSEDELVSIKVKDNGEGIPPDALPNIFERFYRADRSRHRNEGESGLGLAIARSLVEAHQGRIYVESKVNQGTQFTIELPVTA